MKVIKKINNNVAVCLDSQGNEMVAIGTGIGFPSVPYELNDLSRIQRTYYDVDSMYIEFINQVPEDVFQVTAKIVDIFRGKVNENISPNIVFTLADHINFAIERFQKNIQIDNPLQYEIQHLYEFEYEMGLKAIRLIQQELQIRLPKSEATNIALHLVNARAGIMPKKISISTESLLEEVTEIIGLSFQIYIDKNSFNYSRFASHFKYLMKRQEKGKIVGSNNLKLYEAAVKDYPQAFDCVKKIKKYLKEEISFILDEEESLYLMLHINRLCVREDCYQKGITPAQESN